MQAAVLVIAAALEVQDPRERPIDQQGRADQAHEQFADARSDFIAYLNLWSFFHKQKDKLSHNNLRKACKQNFINYVRMREWVDVHQQLSRMLKEQQPGSSIEPIDFDHEWTDGEADAIHRALLTGLLSNIASKGDGHEYTGAGGQKLHLWPGSALFDKKPKWVVAAELVETTRRYARGVGRIQPTMIEPIAGHLVKKTHSDPRWVAETGSAMCSEKVSLYGLVLVPARPVPLARGQPGRGPADVHPSARWSRATGPATCRSLSTTAHGSRRCGASKRSPAGTGCWSATMRGTPSTTSTCPRSLSTAPR